MGIRDNLVVMPDTYGLPVFQIDKTVKQRVGDEIHIMCGAELFGQTQWFCILRLKIDVAVAECQETTNLAIGKSVTDSGGLRARGSH